MLEPPGVSDICSVAGSLACSLKRFASAGIVITYSVFANAIAMFKTAGNVSDDDAGKMDELIEAINSTLLLI